VRFFLRKEIQLHLFTTNNKELLAIVWTFKHLRNYLYGVNNIEIYAGHQPLSFSTSQKNPNIEMKRWYSVVESYSPNIIYNPEATNVVADALSRIQIKNLTESNESVSDQNTQHSEESSFENVIQETRKPLNQFKQPLLIATGRYTIHESINVFGNTRLIIEYDTPEYLISILREYIPPNITIGVHCTLEDFYRIQKPLKDNFINTCFYTKTFVQDVIEVSMKFINK